VGDRTARYLNGPGRRRGPVPESVVIPTPGRPATRPRSPLTPGRENRAPGSRPAGTALFLRVRDSDVQQSRRFGGVHGVVLMAPHSRGGACIRSACL
jgi:hypothetical protein